MPDVRLRELERRAAAGDALAAVRLLRERMRQGSVDPERLRLAARLGHPVAGALLEDERRPAHSLEGLLRALGWWDGTPWIRAALAAAQVALPLWQPTKSSERERGTGRRLLEAVEAWVACPCAGHERQLRVARVPRRASFLRDVGQAARREGRDRTRAARAAIRAAARIAGEAPVRTAVTDELIDWALADPR